MNTAKKAIKTKQTIRIFDAFKIILLFFNVENAIAGINDTPIAIIIISDKLLPKLNCASPDNLNKYAVISKIESKEVNFTINLPFKLASANSINKALIRNIDARYEMVKTRASTPMISGTNEIKPNPAKAKTKKYSLT